jgi:hypothetical protein
MMLREITYPGRGAPGKMRVNTSLHGMSVVLDVQFVLAEDEPIIYAVRLGHGHLPDQNPFVDVTTGIGIHNLAVLQKELQHEFELA